MNTLSLTLTFDQWVSLAGRSLYFSTLLEVNSRNSISKSSFAVNFLKYPEVYFTWEFDCPSFMKINKKEFQRLFEILSADKFVPNDLFRELKDYESLIWCLDHFVLEFWEEVFVHYLDESSFNKRNAFFKMLVTCLSDEHPTVQKAMNFIAVELGINECDLSMAKMRISTASGWVTYFRSIHRRDIFNNTRILHYTCALCKLSIRSRKGLPNHALDNGSHLSCCATIVCNQCAFQYTEDVCRFCFTHVTTDVAANVQRNTLHSVYLKRNIRESHGIGYGERLPQFPPLVQIPRIQRRPVFIHPFKRGTQ
jgi:hypothetical protein